VSRTPLVYLALGDSYTIGTGGSGRPRGFPALIARKLATASGRLVSVRNMGVDGYSADDVIRHELPVLDRIAPDVVSVLIGANDVMRGHSRDDYQASLAWIYDALASRLRSPALAVAISVPDWSVAPAASSFGEVDRIRLVIDGLNAVARVDAAARGFLWVDLTEVSRSNASDPGWFATDGLHPSNAQYAAWVDLIWETVGDTWTAAAAAGEATTGTEA
jgi:lysophospholipase L1-like esterase